MRILTSPAAAGLILLAFWAALLASLRDKSLTFDEGVYAVAGTSYWRLADYRLNPEAGALPQRLAGLPLAAGPYRFPSTDLNHWHAAEPPYLGYDFFYRLGNDARQMAARGRGACGLLAVLLGGLVWAWSRKLFGPAGGLVSLLLYVLNPAVLANGALMTSDMAAALFMAASTWAAWTLLERMSPGRLLVSALLMGGLFVSKLSAVLIVPVVILLAAARCWQGRPLVAAFRGRTWELKSRASRAAALAVVAMAHVAVVELVIWSFYGFRFAAMAHPTAQDHLQFSWQYVLSEAHPAVANAGPASWPLPMRGIDFLRRHELLPEAWLYGFGVILNRTHYGAAFWNGQTSETGWVGYFPYTFLVKTPLAVFGVFALALRAGLWSSRWRRASLPLGIFLAVYGFAAITSHSDIGHRYLLPIYAPLFVLCGAAALERSAGGAACAPFRWPGVALCVLLALLAGETVWRFPNYLAYFNGIVRPGDAYRHLVDSSLDWGQDLPAVSHYIDAHGAEGPFYLSYFGLADPAYYGVTARPLYSFGARYLEGAEDLLVVDLSGSPSDEEWARLHRENASYDLMGTGQEEDHAFAVLLKKPAELRLTAGTYLISATMLQSVCDWGLRGPWNAGYEADYQRIAGAVRPLLDLDYDTRRDALKKRDMIGSQYLLYQFEQYRLARLAAWLRTRRPDATLNGSILVYRLTDADLAAASRAAAETRALPTGS